MFKINRIILFLLSFSVVTVNTIFFCIPVIVFGIIKCIPLEWLRGISDNIIECCARSWVSVNNVYQRSLNLATIQVHDEPKYDQDEWYLIVANHQSWVDIVVLQKYFYKKIPFLKFFLKKELLLVPFLGLAWWALDFPFMQRHSQAKIKNNPSLAKQDKATTIAACQKFRHKPVSVLNFVEGTRFQGHKKTDDYNHLLMPKAGGCALAVAGLSPKLKYILDVTLYYPGGRPTFYQLLSGQVHQVVIDVQLIEVENHLIGDYNEPLFKLTFQKWINKLWLKKDSLLDELKNQYRKASHV
ncbi:MAG: 1-acyl-sn-glycerol-3-phosphate acyltransferase [Shewanellaceae bacterium]|nr:1-acyl-sn-glycerol-3-phosphate acyltransferase [Shewanellaceae bacterium]